MNTSIHPTPGSSECPGGFPTLNTVRERAIFIGDITSRDIQQNLIPGIKFTCAGTITSITMVASEVGGGSRFPEFQIWRNTAGTQYERIDSTSIEDDHATSIPHVYEKTLGTPLQFEANDILGIFTPPVPKLTFKYQQRGGPKNYYIGGPPNPYSTFSLNGAGVLTVHNDYPLLSVAVSPPDCAGGFIDKTTLLIKASILNGNSSSVSYREATQRIIPNMVFPCSGLLLNLTVGALDRGGSSNYPELQLWKRVDETTWVKSEAIGQSTAVTTTDYLNIHVYTPIPPISFHTGEILGFYQPYSTSSILELYLAGDTGPRNYYISALTKSQVEFHTDGISAHTEDRLPLVAVAISKSSSPYSPVTNSNVLVKNISLVPSRTLVPSTLVSFPAVHLPPAR